MSDIYLTLDQAQERYDRQLPDDDNTCIRCEESEAEYGEDYCEYCAEVIRNQNRDKFQPRETY